MQLTVEMRVKSRTAMLAQNINAARIEELGIDENLVRWLVSDVMEVPGAAGNTVEPQR